MKHTSELLKFSYLLYLTFLKIRLYVSISPTSTNLRWVLLIVNIVMWVEELPKLPRPRALGFDVARQEVLVGRRSEGEGVVFRLPESGAVEANPLAAQVLEVGWPEERRGGVTDCIDIMELHICTGKYVSVIKYLLLCTCKNAFIIMYLLLCTHKYVSVTVYLLLFTHKYSMYSLLRTC